MNRLAENWYQGKWLKSSASSGRTPHNVLWLFRSYTDGFVELVAVVGDNTQHSAGKRFELDTPDCMNVLVEHLFRDKWLKPYSFL